MAGGGRDSGRGSSGMGGYGGGSRGGDRGGRDRSPSQSRDRNVGGRAQSIGAQNRDKGGGRDRSPSQSRDRQIGQRARSIGQVGTKTGPTSSRAPRDKTPAPSFKEAVDKAVKSAQDMAKGRMSMGVGETKGYSTGGQNRDTKGGPAGDPDAGATQLGQLAAQINDLPEGKQKEEGKALLEQARQNIDSQISLQGQINQGEEANRRAQMMQQVRQAVADEMNAPPGAYGAGDPRGPGAVETGGPRYSQGEDAQTPLGAHVQDLRDKGHDAMADSITRAIDRDIASRMEEGTGGFSEFVDDIEGWIEGNFFQFFPNFGLASGIGRGIAELIGGWFRDAGFVGINNGKEMTRGEYERYVAENGLPGREQPGMRGPGSAADRVINGGGGPDHAGDNRPGDPAPGLTPTTPVTPAGPVVDPNAWQTGIPGGGVPGGAPVMPSYGGGGPWQGGQFVLPQWVPPSSVMPQWGGANGLIMPG